MICIAIHDNAYDKKSKQFVVKSHIISAISYRILSQGPQTGAYIYYFATLNDFSFHKVVPTNGTLSDLQCPIKGFGLASCLIEIVQLLAYNICASGTLYLGTNSNSDVYMYYQKLGFKLDKDWEQFPNEVIASAEMETNDIEHLYSLYLEGFVKRVESNTPNLIVRNSKHVLYANQWKHIIQLTTE